MRVGLYGDIYPPVRPGLGKELGVEAMKKGARKEQRGVVCAALIGLLAMVVCLSSCASIQTPRDAQAITGSKTPLVSEEGADGPRAGDRNQEEAAPGQRGSFQLKDMMGALVTTLLSPATWSAVFQALAGHGFWP